MRIPRGYAEVTRGFRERLELFVSLEIESLLEVLAERPNELS